MKRCGKCLNMLPTTAFYPNRRIKDGLQGYCKECQKLYLRNRSITLAVDDRRTPSRTSLGRRAYKYGTSAETLAEMAAKHDGLCWLCKVREWAVVDHDHACCDGGRSCGRCVRGLLCMRCNNGLGGLGDSVEGVRAALEYLVGTD